MIDFTDCQIDILSHYGGSDQKRGIIYNNKRYMLKMSDRINTEKRNDLNSSYSNSVYSEYICCHILNMIGIPAQNTLIGEINTVSRHGEKKKTPVVACENFVSEGYELIEFKNIENALLFNKPGKIPKIHEIYEILGAENEYFTKELGEKALQRYWDTFILDAFLGNFDRHANNWGYLINKETRELSLAPIYDCGSCLYPQIADDAIYDIIHSEEEVDKRIFVFPTAALELEDGRKAGYYDYISSMKNKDCTEALKRIYPLINIDKIKDFILNIEDISDIRKEFYCFMLEARYEKVLTASYTKIMSECENNKFNEKEEDNDEYELE